MAAGDIPLYFEGSWSILSTIGMINALFGLMVVGITGYSPIALVPIVVSVSAAIANGLCYYALYQTHGTNALLLGAIFADLFWLIQEAGLSFYSYMILNRVLRNRPRIIFLVLFWIFMLAIVALRMAILVTRARNTLMGNTNQGLQDLVARLHIGYFVALAVIEIISAYFLLRIFSQAKKGSAEVAKRGGLFHYLTQSTEIRLATLALIGITRAITYSFQKTMKASDVTGQVDRFVFTLECLFPMVMYIDILASRIARVTNSHPSSNNGPAGSRSVFQRSRMGGDVKMYSMNRTRPNMGPVGHHTSSSQERIVDRSTDEEMGVKSAATTLDFETEKKQEGTISKTVEFQFHESAA